MKLRATDLPELRRDTMRWLDGSDATVMFKNWADRGEMFGQRPNTQQWVVDLTKGKGDTYRQAEKTRWDMAELYYVTEEMGELAKYAAKTLPPVAFYREDLPAEYGVMFFAKPISTVSTFYGQTMIYGVSWGLYNAGSPSGPDLWISLWADAEFSLVEMVKEKHLTPQEARLLAGRLPPLSYDGEGLVHLGRDLTKEVPFIETTEPMYCTAVAISAMILMQQEIASVKKMVARPQDLKMFRRKKLNPSRVRIVTLRHVKGPHIEGSAEGKEYSYRWFVRGHWRKQWYSSTKTHKAIWIHTHIKGPEDAPLLTGPVVNNWRR